MMLPEKYKWLENEPGPKILVEALKLYGIKETKGAEHNPVILGWAGEIGGWVGKFYNADEIAWCGLFVGICAKRAGFPFTQELLGATKWLKWGKQIKEAMLGDVLVFSREGGGHVGIYVGEDKSSYHVLGGNQGDCVSIVRILKVRCVGIRRCIWNIAQPENIRQVFLDADGTISTNEA